MKRNAFFITLVLFALFAMCNPTLFIWVKPYISLGLGIIMFGIGININFDDLKSIHKKFSISAYVLIIKYTVIPIFAYILGSLLHISTLNLVGLILISATAGGTASNVMTFLSNGNVVLTVFLTFITTILTPLLMPVILYLVMSHKIEVPFVLMFVQITKIIIFPICLGILLKLKFKENITSLQKIFPLVSIIVISIVVACVVGLMRTEILLFPTKIILSVLLLNLFGYLIGFILSKILRLNGRDSTSITFELSIFDTGIAVVIAASFFGPQAALPAAILSFIQNFTAVFIMRFMSNDMVLIPIKEI